MNLVRMSLLFILSGLFPFAAFAGMTIAEIRTVGPGQQVTIAEGVIASTVDTIAASTSSSFQVQDETGGITVFGSAAAISGLLQGLEAGDILVGLTGTTGQFNGLLQLQGPFTLSSSRKGEGPPSPLPVSPHDFQPGSPTAEGLESRLVSLRDVRFQQAGAFSGNTNYTVTSSEGVPATVRISHGGLPVAGEAIPTGRVNITGIFSQFSTRSPPDDGYQLLLLAPEALSGSSSFDQWLSRHFVGAELRDPGVGAPTSDPDGDGASNLLEFALGGDPRAPGTAALPEALIGEIDGSDHLQLRFRRMAEAADAIYRVEVSSNLKEWQTIWTSTGYPFSSWAGDWEIRTVADPLPLHATERRFIRLAVEAPDEQRPPFDELTPMRIVSWNIEWFPGRSANPTAAEREAHIDGVRNYLAQVSPDILLLQEIRDQASLEAALALFEGYQIHVLSAFRLGGGALAGQQLAIASRLTAQSAFFERFVAPAGGEPAPPRGFAFAALELPGNRILLCYSVHLKSNASGETEDNIAMREESARQLLAHITDMRQLYSNRRAIYVAVGGDFNVRLESPEMAHEQTIELFQQDGFHSTWEGVPFSQRITWPGRGAWPDATFDYILVNNLGTPAARVLQQPRPDLSDHNPVEVTIDP